MRGIYNERIARTVDSKLDVLKMLRGPRGEMACAQRAQLSSG